MQNILNNTERQRIEKHFASEYDIHPLLAVCRNVFSERAAKLEGVKADFEDIFCLVALVLDYLANSSEALSQQDVDNLWTGILMQAREWPNATVNDRIVIADTVFRIVRKLLCHHWDTYYSEWLFDMFTETINRESAYGDKEEQLRFKDRLSEFSEQLNKWINNEFYGNLSIEVEAVIKGKKAEINTINSRRGRKSIDPNDITASFDYLPRVNNRVERLQAFFDRLNKVFVDCDKKDFVDMFQGKTTKDKIFWIREIRELHYLIDHIEEWISWPKSYDKWQMTCARFQIRVKTKESYEIKDLKLTQFSKGGKVPETIVFGTVWMFSFMSEVIKHKLSAKEIEKAVEDCFGTGTQGRNRHGHGGRRFPGHTRAVAQRGQGDHGRHRQGLPPHP